MISLFVLLSKSTFARPINNNEAKEIAKNYLNLRNINLSNKFRYHQIRTIEIIKDLSNPETKEVLAYIINIEPKGFMVVSSDTDIEPIIAYSFRENWSWDVSEKNIFYNMVIRDIRLRRQAIPLLENEIIEEINQKWNRYLNNNNSIMKRSEFNQWPEEGTTITGGWIETTWHQGSPYNDYCPIDPIYNKRCITGCVATAMAQIVNYHEYLGIIQLTEEDAYISKSNNITIDWDSLEYNFPSFNQLNKDLITIQNKYTNDEKLTHTDEAILNFVCGVLLHTDYSFQVSSAIPWRIEDAFINDFGYANAHFEFYNNISYNFLKENMIQGLPAQITISDDEAIYNHSIITDGYNTDGFFHLNFGWGNLSPDLIEDAWYYLPDRMPKNYSIIYNVVVDILPFNDNEEKLSFIIVNKDKLEFNFTVEGETNIKSLLLRNVSLDSIEIDYIVTSGNFLISIDQDVFNDSIDYIVMPPHSKINLYVKLVPEHSGFLREKISISYHEGKKYLSIDLLGFVPPVSATVINEGNVSGYWDKSGSPYYICGDIFIRKNNELFIDQGTDVMFFTNSKLTVENSGRLIANGTESDSIYFYSKEYNEFWNGIHFYSSGSDDSLRYCVIKDYRSDRLTTSEKSGAIYCDHSSPVILHSRITQNTVNSSNGGIIFCYWSSPKIIHSKIENNNSIYGNTLYLLESYPVIQNSIFNNNNAKFGSTIYCEDSSPVISDSKITQNITTSTYGGTIFCYRSSPKIFNSGIENNNSKYGGALFLLGSSPIIQNSVICNNTAEIGGAIYCDKSSLIISDSKITQNIAALGKGGAIFCNESSPKLLNCIIENNNSMHGGALYLQESSPMIRSSIIYNNNAEIGGAIYCDKSSPIISDSKITQNIAVSDKGGAIFCNESSPEILNSLIENNGSLRGGALFLQESSPIIQNSVICNNTAEFGGAIYSANSSPIISHSRIAYNITSYKNGGAIFCFKSSPEIFNSILENNSSIYGGALFLQESFSMIRNSIICNNTAVAGGAIYSNKSSSDLVNVTISNNTASMYGGAICLESLNNFKFKNSIIWENFSEYGSFFTIGYKDHISFKYSNIDTNDSNWNTINEKKASSSSIIIEEGVISEDPLFGDTKNNDFTLLQMSPCIDAGDPDDDIGNEPIPHGYIINMGAYGGTYQAAPTNDTLLTIVPDHIDFEYIKDDTNQEEKIYLKNGNKFTINITEISCTDLVNFSLLDFSDQEIIKGFSFSLESGSVDSFKIIFNYRNQPNIHFSTSITFKCIEVPDQVLSVSANVQPRFMLFQNYPNPFNSKTIIHYQLPEKNNVMFNIYNLLGQNIKTLVNREMESGPHQIIWNGNDNNGKKVNSGIYFYQLKSGRFCSVKKMNLML
jgi:predicted outer membrane repeat protein